MKREFEGKFFTKKDLEKRGGFCAATRVYKKCIDFIDCLSPNKPFRITVEDLPESKPDSKPEPCEECTPSPGKAIRIDHYGKCVKCGRLIKPEPDHFVEVNKMVLPTDKNCGNCKNKHPESVFCLDGSRPCSHWQPKAAEPQSWEQKFHGEFSADFYAMATKHMDNVKAFIRAEIERVREDEKQAVLKYMRRSDTSASTLVSGSHIELNHHRSEK